MEKFGSMAYPTRKDENWKYTNVSAITQQPFHFSPKGANSVKFENLPPQVTMLSVEAASQDSRFSDFILSVLENRLNEAENAFTCLNLAFAQHGIFMDIPVNAHIEAPIKLHYQLGGDGEQRMVNPLLILRIGTSAEATVVEHYDAENDEGGNFYNANTLLILGKNATLHHLKIQEVSAKTFLIHQNLVEQEKDSALHSFTLDLGGKIVRNNLKTSLNSTNTTTHLLGVYLANDDQHIDNQTFIDHANPHCFSNELYKGIIGGNGRGVFNGKVLVRKDAQKTNAFQQNANLLLSESSRMDAKPQLEIFADDVKCSHGATIGQLDENAIFYLKSRGLTDNDAKGLLKFAFVGEVVEKIENEDLRRWVEDKIFEKLNG